ncbi:MAG: hypothetical protein WCR42_09065 [bacterium]
MKKSFLLGVLLIALLIVPFANAVAENNVPRTINYTGNLFDYAGQPINKAVDLNVKIYNSQTGGSALWTEDQRNVQVEYGYFSINLGTESPLNLDFKTQYWVELSVNGNSYARVPFTSTPYTFQSMRSFRADTANVAKAVLDKSITIASLADETRVVTGDVTGTYPELYIKDGVVVSKIGKGQITNYHISGSVSLPPAGPAGGALTGQYPDPKLAENAVETFNIMDGSITYPKFQNAYGPEGTILVWNGTAWVESSVPEWQTPEVDGVIGNEVMWATNGLEIITDTEGLLGVGIVYGGVTNDMLAGDITTDKLFGDITMDKFANGNMPGQVMWWNQLQKEWQLTPNAPREDYVMKWVFDHEAGQALLEWAPDNMSIPFLYDGPSINPESPESAPYSSTMFELVLDGARAVSNNSVHGIAVTIKDDEAGSAMVLKGSGMNKGNMIPVAVITANPYVGSASYDKGILNVSASVGTLADATSFGELINHTVTGTNHGISSMGAGIYNTVGINAVNGTIFGLDATGTSTSGDATGKVIGVNGMAMGTGSDIAVGVAGTSMNAKYNTGLFGGVNTGSTPWTTIKANLPASITNVGAVAYGPVSSNTLALYAYGNSQFDGDITVKNNALVNQNLTVQGIGTFNGTLNTNGNFQLDGVQGQYKELMIGMGNGITPTWISVANLMEDLVAGAGLVSPNYDGSVTRTFAVEYDATLKMDAAGDAGKIGLNLANPNTWTALQTFNAPGVDINAGNIDGTIIGASVPTVGTFTNLFATNETVSGLLTAATVDLNGGNIDNTVIGIAIPAAGYFTDVIAANITSNTSINTNGTFALDGVQGATKQLMIGQGNGVTPVWISVANLMEDLTDGEGIVDFTYDGSATMKVKTDIDGTTLKYDISGDDGKVIVNQAWNFAWTGNNTWAGTSIFNNSLTATKAVTLGDGDADDVIIKTADWSVDMDGNIFTNGKLDVNGATTLNNTLTVAGIAKFNNVTESTSITTGSVVVAGGVGIAKNVNIGGALTVAGNTDLNDELDVAKKVDLAAPGLMTTVRGTFNVDEAVTLDATLAVAGIAKFNNTTESTTTTDGAVIVAGGVGIAKNVNIGGALAVAGNTDLNGELDVAKKVDLAAPGLMTTVRGTFNVDQAVTLDATLDVAGIAKFNNTTESTTIANGAVIVAGGVGIAKNVNIGGALAVAGNTDLLGILKVTGNTDLNGELDVAKKVDLAAPGLMTTVRGTLNVDEDATFDANIYAPTGTIDVLTSDDVTVTNSLTLEDAAALLASNGSGTPTPGNIGDIFVSRGPGLSPEWTTSIPLLDVTDLSTDHFVVNDNTMPGMEPYFEVPYLGTRKAVFGAPGSGQGVDVTIYGKLTTDNLEVINEIPYLDVTDLYVGADLNVAGNINMLTGMFTGGDAKLNNLKVNDIDALNIKVQTLEVTLQAKLTDIEVHGLAKFYDGMSVTGGNLTVSAGNNIIAGNDLEVHHAINNPTTSGAIQLPVLINDPQGLQVTGDLLVGGLFTVGLVDINGGTIDNTVIGATTPANGTFTNLTSTVSMNTTGTFKLDGIEGTAGQLMIGAGAGNTPTWSTVSSLMADLTAGAGLVGTTYDGSAASTFAVDYDATLKMDVAGDAGKLGLNLGTANSWTGIQQFSTVDINGGNIDGTVIGNVTASTGKFTTVTSNHLVLSTQAIAAKADFLTATAAILLYSDTQNIALSSELPTRTSGEVIYIINKSAGARTIMGTSVPINQMITLVYVGTDWYAIP